MDEADRVLRNLTYRLVSEMGRAPTAHETAEALGATEEAVSAGWQRLHAQYFLVLDTAGALRMAPPFSAVATPYRVWAAGRWWYANCGWDAFGVCAALHVDGHIQAICADCGQLLRVDVLDGAPDVPSLLWHCLVPASQWWDDIVFT